MFYFSFVLPVSFGMGGAGSSMNRSSSLPGLRGTGFSEVIGLCGVAAATLLHPRSGVSGAPARRGLHAYQVWAWYEVSLNSEVLKIA